jgi:hypothetical protein
LSFLALVQHRIGVAGVNDVVIGGLISLVSSLVTTVVVVQLAYRRELRTRWDRDTLTTVSTSLVSAERAMGRIYSWAQGELTSVPPARRPNSVDEIIDLTYYQLEQLAVLFPGIAELADGVQHNIVLLSDLTAEARKHADRADSQSYLVESEALREDIRDKIDQMRSAAQRRLAIA